MDQRGSALARGRARGTGTASQTPQENVPFYQRRGVGPRHPIPPPAAAALVEMDVDTDDIPDPDTSMPMDPAVEEEAMASGSSRNGSNGNGRRGNGSGHGSNGNGSSGSGSPHAPGESETAGEESSASHLRDESTANRGNGRGVRPDLSDYVASRPDDVNKQGTSGQSINLIANYFELQHKRNWLLKQYRVDVRPEEDETRIRKHLVNQHKDNLPAYIFDGTMLITFEPLIPEPLLLNSKRNDKEYVVEIRFIREFAAGDPMTSQFHNLVVRKTLQMLQFDLLGRHYYDRTQSIALPNWRLELWPGYMTSMRQCEVDVLLNVEVTHKMIRTDNVYLMMDNWRREFREHPNMRAKINELLIGRIVMTRYNSKTYRIDQIDWDRRADGSFMKNVNGVPTEISFRQYYNERHNVSLQHRDQPLLISVPRQRTMHNRFAEQTPISLIPELCYITGLDEDQRANFQLMKDMSQHLHMVPDRRVQKLKNIMERIRGNPEIVADMTSWGVRFHPDLVKVPGRVLPSEDLVFGGNREQNYKADWSMAFRSMQLFSTPGLSDWCLIVPQRCDRGVDNLIQTMQRVGRPLNYIISPPELIRLPQDRPNVYIEAIDRVLQQRNGNIQLMFFILPSPKIELYSAIKKRVSVDFGVPSQCFLSKNVGNKGLMSIATKVVIQMNAKQGGEPWCVSNPLKNVMVIGFDVYHSAGRKSKSVGAMVASYSHTLAQFYSTISYFSTQDEMAQNMGMDILKCLKAYKSQNKILPTRIMFYRDGVGEGQLRYVYNSELQQMKEIVAKMYADEQLEMPKLTFIVVNKRINTRLFFDSRASYENPPPGTVVDSVVTLPERWDFFLISQSVRQGTVSPCSYNVLFDNSNLPADRIQIFTYKMCHLYFNWSGTVGVPAPCQYAHKLAYLTGLALGNKAHQRLQFLLHYL